MTRRIGSERAVHAHYNPMAQAVDLYFVEYDHLRTTQKRLVVVDAEVQDEATRMDPSIQVDEIAAQRLMDQLWACGFRPTEGKGSAGALAATERHLADMQKIVFTYLEMAPPNDSDRPNHLGNGR